MFETYEDKVGKALNTLYSGALFLSAGDESAAEQLFCGDVQVFAVVTSLNPLTGQARIFGDDQQFQITLDREQLEFDNLSERSFPWYRQQLMLASHKANRTADVGQWRELAVTRLAGRDPLQWQPSLLRGLEEQIPSVTEIPDLAIAMSRFLGGGNPFQNPAESR